MTQVQVRGKVPGGDSGLDVLIDVPADVTTAAELIRLAVEEQIRVLRDDMVSCRQVLDRQYLSLAEIRAQAATGAVRMPSGPAGPPDVVTEVARAHQAFKRNVFAVFAGGRQLRRLNEEVMLRSDRPVMFLRLTPLAGG